MKYFRLIIVAISLVLGKNEFCGDKLSRREKLTERLLTRPSDFTFAELTTLLGHYGYAIAGAGKTGGSRVTFSNGSGDYIRLHKPHPRSILKLYQVEDVIKSLRERGFLLAFHVKRILIKTVIIFITKIMSAAWNFPK